MERVMLEPAGQMALAIGLVASRNGHTVTARFRTAERLAIAREKGQSEHLPGIGISSLNLTDDLRGVKEASAIILGPRSMFLREVVEGIRPYLSPQTYILNISKGFEAKTLKTPTQVILDVIPEAEGRVATLSGPTFASEIARGLPTVAVIAAQSKETSQYFTGLLNSKNLILSSSEDVIGVEVLGACKNIMALMAGMSVGLEQGDNARAAIITLASKEVRKLLVAMGGESETADGFAGLGDLILTCTSSQSRNFNAGLRIAKGELPQAIRESGEVVEGLDAVGPAITLAERRRVRVPIIEGVGRVIKGDITALKALDELLTKMSRLAVFNGTY